MNHEIVIEREDVACGGNTSSYAIYVINSWKEEKVPVTIFIACSDTLEEAVSWCREHGHKKVTINVESFNNV